jgi:signal transduction histidine kinase/ligand-binding sensor domain-containing protein
VISWLRRYRRAVQEIALLCLAARAYGLDPNRPLFQYVQENWNTEAKFPGGAVNAIAQTSDGYLWIGMDRGLFRFDGFNFVAVSLPSLTGASNVPILGLLTDAGGNLWVRVQGSDVLRQKNGKFEPVRYGARPPSFEYGAEPPTSQVTAVSKDRNGDVLVSDVINGTFRFEAENTQRVLTPTMLPGASPVISIAETSDGKIWLGTLGAGLFLLADRHAAAVNAAFPERKINCLLPIRQEDLLVGTDNGLYHWNGKDYRREALPSSLGNLQILSMLRDRDSNIWVATDRGLLRLNRSGTSFSEEKELRGNGAINVLFEDREGNVWVGGARGLGRIRDTVFVTYSPATDPRFENPGPIYLDTEGRTWFAPGQGGLYTLKDARIQQPTSVAGDDVVYSITGRGNDIWIGRQRGGLTHLEWRNGTITSHTFTAADGLAQNSVYAVLAGRDGSVWAGTLSGGVSRFHEGLFTTYTAANGLAGNTVSAIVEARDGAMWFATSNGLSSFSKGQWRTYSTRDGLPSATVNCLFEDSEGVLWSGTSSGLAVLVSGKVQVASLPEDLREPIFGIAEDNQEQFWITTSHHVFEVPRDKLLAGKSGTSDVREYGPADGLPSSQGIDRSRSVISASDGKIWISVNGGLSVVDPSHQVHSWPPAIAHVASVMADGTALTPIDSIRVPAAHRRITFAYTALSLAVPERIRFRYFLEPFDRQWSEPSPDREAVYTNLGPGTYHFHLLASNSYGEWNGAESVVGFEVEPALWQTWWFRSTLALLLTGMVAAFYRLHLHRLTQQLNLRFEERLAERTRIAQELHDTLLQGLLSASMQLHVADDQLAGDSPAKPLVNRVLALMGRVIEEGRNAVRGLRSAHDDSSDLGQAFSRVAQELDVQEEVDFRVVVEGLPRALHPVIRDDVYRIGREALVNAFRHSRANRIEVEVDYSTGYLSILIRDNGCGIDPEVLRAGREGHWGLPGMHERAEKIGAKLRVWSRPNSGTEVELTVPGQVAFQSPATAHPREWFARFFPWPVAHETREPESKQRQ